METTGEWRMWRKFHRFDMDRGAILLSVARAYGDGAWVGQFVPVPGPDAPQPSQQLLLEPNLDAAKAACLRLFPPTETVASA